MDGTAQAVENPFDGPVTEHITLSSDPLDQQLETVQLTNCRFSQPGDERTESREFTLFDERLLAVCVEPPDACAKRYRLDLAFLDPVPQRLSGIAWRWLYAAVALAVISALAVGLNWLSATPLLQQRWLWLSVALAAATLVTVLVFVRRSRRSLTFYSLHGRAPLLEIAARNPDRRAVERFVAELQQRMQAARRQHWQDKTQFLRDELRAHQRLHDEGVLPEHVYEASKARILAAHG